MFQPDFAQDGKCFSQPSRGVGAERAQLLDGDQPVQRRRDRHSIREGMKTSEVHERDHAPLLDVELARQPAPEPERGTNVGGGARHSAEEVRVLGCPANGIYERRDYVEPARHMAEIKGHGCPHEVRTVRCLEAGGEDREPFGLRHAPLAAPRQNLGVVGPETAASKSGVDVLREAA